jgi:light-independent protochlorophyllide reductase subunit L
MFAMEDTPDKEECLVPYNDIADFLIQENPVAAVPVPIGDREIFAMVGGWQ